MKDKPTSDHREPSDIIEDLEVGEAAAEGVSGGAADYFLKTGGIQGEGTAPASSKIVTNVHLPLS